MCYAWIPMAMSAVSSITSASGAATTAAANAASAQYQSQVAANNQTIANMMSTQALAAGQVDEETSRMVTGRAEASERAKTAASGITGDGTPTRVAKGIADVGELDALTIRNNAAWKAFGYQAQASGFGAQAQLDQFTASNALKAGQTNIMSSLLGGASSIADKWSKFSQVGAIDSSMYAG